MNATTEARGLTFDSLGGDSLETGYLVKYRCPCGARWSMQWSCACDDECPACGADVEAFDYKTDGTYSGSQLDHYNRTGALPSLALFEVMAAGFTGDGDTDDRVLWIAAESIEDARAVTRGQRARCSALDDDCYADVDFILPAEADQLRERLAFFRRNPPPVTQV